MNRRCGVIRRIILIVISGILSIGLFVFAIQYIRWDKVPISSDFFIFGIYNKDFGIQADNYGDLIYWDDLDDVPDEKWVENNGHWFCHINTYSVKLLQRYMRKNNLAILPRKYLVGTHTTFEELLEILAFEEIPETQTGKTD